MADIPIIFQPQSVLLPSTNSARIDKQNNYYVLFEDTVSTSCRLPRFELPGDYLSNPRISLGFSLKDTQVGTLNVKWSIYVQKDSADQSADWDVDSFATANAGTKTLINNQPAGYPKKLEISLTNFDSAVAGDWIVIKIELDVTGTAVGDVELGAITFIYSNT